MRDEIKKIIEEVQSKIFLVPAILDNDYSYHTIREKLYDYLKAGFEIKELRECPVRFKFSESSNEVHVVQLRRFYLDLCYWYPFMALGKGNILDESYILKVFDSKERKEFFDKKVIEPFEDELENSELNMVIHETLFLLSEVSRDFNVILGISMNMDSFAELYNKNDEFKDLLDTDIDENEQPSIIEQQLDSKLKDLMKILTTEDNVLKPILLSGGNVKAKQLIEFFIAAGYKPDINGNTLPIPIKGNFTKGLRTVSDLYIESNSSIKALLANKFEMGDGGYFSKKFMQLCAGYILDSSVEECNSIRPIPYNIKTKSHLKLLAGQYYVSSTYKKIMIKEEDTHLIGKTLMVKSPITCSLKDGKICKTCYGRLSKINNNGMSIGALASAKLTEPISQNILSTKHLLQTNSEVIEFTPEFDYLFSLHSNEIVTNLNTEYNLFDYRLVLNKEDIMKISENDDNLQINDYVTSFKIVHHKTGEEIIIKETKDKKLYLSPELTKYMASNKKKILKDGVYVIDMTRIECMDTDDGEEISRIFIIEIANNELTKPLYDIISLFEYFKDREGGIDASLEYMAQRLLDLLIEADIHEPGVFNQLMLKPLVRKRSNILEYPNWSSYRGSCDYQVNIVDNALKKHPNVLVSISSLALKKQLETIDTFTKHSSSYIDPLFRR